MNFRKTIILIAIVLAGLLLVYLGYQWYQLRSAGKLLDTVLDGIDADYRDFPCLAEPIDDGILYDHLEQSKNQLQKVNFFGYRPSHVYLQLGRISCLMGEPEEAVKTYRRYTQIRPKNPLGHLELGFAYEKLCSTKIAVDENRSGETYIYFCEDEELYNSIITAWREGASPEDFYEIGEQHLNENNLNESLRWYRRALALDPEWSDPYFGMGFTNEKLLQWEDAARYYNRPLEINKFRREKISDTYLRLGIIYQSEHPGMDISKALEMYNLAIEIDNFSSGKTQGNAYYKRGEIYILQGRNLSEVIEDFKTAITIYPNHHWAHLKLGSAIYNFSGDIELAEIELLKSDRDLAE